MSQVIVLVYSNGRMFQGPRGITFEGQKRAIQIKRSSISYDMLKKMIAAKLRLRPHQIISTLTYRFPISQRTYTDLEILDSEDVDCMISAAENHSGGVNVLELYVEIIDDVHSENIGLFMDDDDGDGDDDDRSVKVEDGGGVPNDGSSSDAEVAGDSKALFGSLEERGGEDFAGEGKGRDLDEITSLCLKVSKTPELGELKNEEFGEFRRVIIIPQTLPFLNNLTPKHNYTSQSSPLPFPSLQITTRKRKRKAKCNVEEHPQQTAGEEDLFPPPSSSTPQPESIALFGSLEGREGEDFGGEGKGREGRDLEEITSLCLGVSKIPKLGELKNEEFGEFWRFLKNPQTPPLLNNLTLKHNHTSQSSPLHFPSLQISTRKRKAKSIVGENPQQTAGEEDLFPPPSSSTPQPESWKYHVFLNFRGDDTRMGFTNHLYASLERKGIITYRDDKNLGRGEVISTGLVKAIEESMIAITIFSENYANSTWCLDELQKIVECKHNLGQFVVPIFYYVDPPSVRHQRCSFKDAFINYEDKFGPDCEKILRWRAALKEVANYSGFCSSRDQPEAIFVDKITDHIHKLVMKRLPSYKKNLASRLEEVIRQLDIGLKDVRSAYMGHGWHDSTPQPESWKYHVFLSFRGADTRMGFTDHLYASLERKGIITYRDDKDLGGGEIISTGILKAIEESMIAITIFSENYASSSWCLGELQKIVECKHNLGQFVVPIFYYVEPSDVRHQRCSFGEAFMNLEKRLGPDSREKILGWRAALKEVTSYSGFSSRDQPEAIFVDEITDHIHKLVMERLPSCTENLASRLEKVIRQLDIGLKDVRSACMGHGWHK